MTRNLEDQIRELVSKFSLEKVNESLKNLRNESKTEILTIIADDTMHQIPDELMVGEVYFFSHDSLDISSNNILKKQILSRLMDLDKTLNRESWSEVRLIFSGHALLPAQIKMLVYRRLHLNTKDIGYFGKSGYREVDIDFRDDLKRSISE